MWIEISQDVVSIQRAPMKILAVLVPLGATALMTRNPVVMIFLVIETPRNVALE